MTSIPFYGVVNKFPFHLFLPSNIRQKDLSPLNSPSDDAGRMMKTKINPTFLTQSTTPKVNVRLMGSNAIEFAVEGLAKYFMNYVVEECFMIDICRGCRALN